MVNYSEISLDQTFSALSDPIRRALLKRLRRGPASVTELAVPFSISLPAILKHLNYLRIAGLVAGKKIGRVHKFELSASPLQGAADYIAAFSRFWDQKSRNKKAVKYL